MKTISKRDGDRNICDALLELLREKPFARISVTEIIGRAHVSRSTFYYHFDSKDDVLAAIVDEVVRGMNEALPADGVWNEDMDEIDRWCTVTMAYVEGHLDTMTPIMGDETASRMLFDHLFEQSKGVFTAVNQSKALPGVDIELLMRCRMLALFELYRAWVREGYARTKEEIRLTSWSLYDPQHFRGLQGATG